MDNVTAQVCLFRRGDQQDFRLSHASLTAIIDPVTTTSNNKPAPIDQGARLAAAASVSGPQALLAPLIAYARGHASGNPEHFRDAFRSTAHIEGIRDGAFVSWTLSDYCAIFTGSPAGDEAARRRTITDLRQHGTIAHAEMFLEHGPDTFTDLFILVEEAGRWRIANKVYDQASQAAEPRADELD
jgi:Putative lumazine-binding